MIRWVADQALNELIRRYYGGEASLWATIRQEIDQELRRRAITRGAYHIRLLGRAEGGYDVLIDDATPYAQE